VRLDRVGDRLAVPLASRDARGEGCRSAVTAHEPALNDRQRAYLLAIFETDQATEADMRSVPFSPFHDRPKASEWRWIEYSEPIPLINKPASRLYAAIRKASKIDQGTGSTFDALAARGLVQVGTRGPDGYPHLRITPAGRRLVRSWTGAKTYKAPPAGALKEWHWRALAKAYAAGAEGLEGSYGDYANIGWNTWLRLRDYKRGALIEERASGSLHNPTTGSSGTRYRIHITGAGWALYEREWARYRPVDCTNVAKSGDASD
jgi:hypothetical protein